MSNKLRNSFIKEYEFFKIFHNFINWKESAVPFDEIYQLAKILGSGKLLCNNTYVTKK